MKKSQGVVLHAMSTVFCEELLSSMDMGIIDELIVSDPIAMMTKKIGCEALTIRAAECTNTQAIQPKARRARNNIVELIDWHVDPITFYIVQLYAKGGDVFDRLAQRTS
mgnify:CR=1 FL=1